MLRLDTPSPLPAEFDPNAVTPGFWGFIVTFVLMVAVVLLVLDMTHRVRRLRYREQVREQLAAEEAAGMPDRAVAPERLVAANDRDAELDTFPADRS